MFSDWRSSAECFRWRVQTGEYSAVDAPGGGSHAAVPGSGGSSSRSGMISGEMKMIQKYGGGYMGGNSAGNEMQRWNIEETKSES